MTIKKYLPIVVLALSGCSSLPSSIPDLMGQADNFDASVLYLRGEFSWWDAVEDYRLKAFNSDSERYQTKVNLIADGQPYKFKFADENWSQGYNCGLDNQERLRLGMSVELNCNTQSSQNPFVFIPEKTGDYTFTLEIVNGIKRVSVSL